MYEYEKREINRKRKMRKKQQRWIKFVSKTGRVTHSKLSLFMGATLFGLIIPIIFCLITRWLSKGGFHLYYFHRDIDGPYVTFFQNYMIIASYGILLYTTGSLLAPIIYMGVLFFIGLIILYPFEVFMTGQMSDLIQEWAESVGIPLVMGAPLFICFFEVAAAYIAANEDKFADARHLAGEENKSPWAYEYEQVKKDMRKSGAPHSFDENSYVYLTSDDIKRAYMEVLEEKAKKKRKRLWKKKDPGLEDYIDLE